MKKAIQTPADAPQLADAKTQAHMRLLHHPFDLSLRARLMKLSGRVPDRGSIRDGSGGMKQFFRRELTIYAEAHADRINGVTHIIGNPMIFIGVVLPLCLVPMKVFGVQTSLAPLLVIPALLMWMAWDFALGLGIAIAAVPLLWIAGAISEKIPVGWVWIIAVILFVLGWALQIVGHQIFEKKQPTAINNPVQSLIAPMHMIAKLYISLGFRPDLAALLRRSPGQAPCDNPLTAPLNPVKAGTDVSRPQ
jgi:uncharacterized membrane protein YGL010W